MKLTEFINIEKEDEKAKKTISQYQTAIKQFIDSIDHNDDITKNDLIEYRDLMHEHNYAAKTMQVKIVAINKFIRFCEVTENQEYDRYIMAKHNQKLYLKSIKIQEKDSIGELLEQSELKRMIRKAKEENQMDIYFIQKIYAQTGIRASELNFFTAENLKSNYIEVTNKGKVRTIIVPNDLRRDLRKYARSKKIKKGNLFVNPDTGKIYDQSTIYRKLKRLAGRCRGVKLSKIHPHSYRHLFAVNYIRQGGTLSDLQDILGHNSIKTTKIYVQTTKQMKKKELERMKLI